MSGRVWTLDVADRAEYTKGQWTAFFAEGRVRRARVLETFICWQVAPDGGVRPFRAVKVEEA